MKRFFIKILAGVLVFSLLHAMPAAAATYRDVPLSHTAHAAIDWVSNPANGSFMVGDASNNFHPNRVMDKFEASVALALAAGFKYAWSNITPAEQALFDRAYANHRATLDGLGASAQWRRSNDREIAYLLELGILKTEELPAFLTAPQLTRQEAAAFIVRLAKLDITGITLPHAAPFRDDTQIRIEYKAYAYAAVQAGITEAFDNFFNPTHTVNRAAFALMCYNALADAPATQVTVPNTSQVVVTTLHGVIAQVTPPNGLRITSQNVTEAYRLTANAVIVLDNVQRNINALSAGMQVTAGLNAAGDIVSMLAYSNATPSPSPTVTPRPTATPTPVPATPTATPFPTPQNAVVYFRDEGYVVHTSIFPNPALTVRLARAEMLTNEVVVSNQTYTLAPNVLVLRGETPVNITDIRPNEPVSFDHFNNTIHIVRLPELLRQINGTLVEKRFDRLIVRDSGGRVHDLRTTHETLYTRTGVTNAGFNDLRAGDTVQVFAEYDRVVAVQAAGVQRIVDGTLEALHITLAGSSVVVRNADGAAEAFILAYDAIDVYTLRLNMALTLYVEGNEAYRVEMKPSPAETGTLALLGLVQSTQSGHTVVIATHDGIRETTYTLRVDENTVNALTGEPLRFADIQVGRYVYVVLRNNHTNFILSMTLFA
jgi:hypothetical protein